MTLSREVHLVSRPSGLLPDAGDVTLVQVPVPAPEPGQVVVRNLFMSLDPGMLLRTRDLSGLHIPDYEVGRPLWGDAIGEVVESASPDLRAGEIVWHRLAWRDYAVAEAGAFRRIDPDAYPRLSHHLSFAVVAYIGMEIAAVGPGDTVFVSSAAGGVGSVAGQIARLRGARRVIGSVGSPEKVAFVTGKLGFDAAFDYHAGIRQSLGDLDVYFDNVGGAHLEAAIDAMNPHGRIVMCGATGVWSSDEPHSVSNMFSVVGKRLTLRGFTTFDHIDLLPRFDEEFGEWVRTGKVVLPETIVQGLENGLSALRHQIEGAYVGKVVLEF